MNSLELTLSGPFQSYGDNPCFMDYHSTDYYPTKSAIVGMIGCAMGVKKNSEQQGKLAKIESMIDVYVERLKETPKIHVDFQTVSPTQTKYLFYKKGKLVVKDPEEKLIDYRGNKCDTGKMKTVQKEYIVDQVYKVYIFGNEDYLETIKDAIKWPMYPIYLGRKCCIPDGNFKIESQKNEIDPSWKRL